MTKVIFMGTPEFSVPILEGLLETGYEVLGVVTQPDRPVGRKHVLTPTPVKEAAIAHNLPVFQPEKISQSEELETILTLNPDFLITAAFGQFLPERLLKLPKIAALNVHASLLPKYRGGAPVHYSIINGDNVTGVTIMEMVKKMDAGGIFTQSELPITESDDVGTMFEKLSLLGKELLLETLPKIETGELKAIPQDEKLVTFSPNIKREEEKINWEKTAEAIDWQVRGMRPWPVAYTTYQGTRWKLWKVTPLAETTNEKPGTVVEAHKKNLIIACGQGSLLKIDMLQPSGKGKLSANEFLNGSGKTLQIGDMVNS